MMPAALIFDVDGTLAETEELHRQAFNETFAAFGLPWHWDRVLYRRLLEVAGGKERLRHYLDAYEPPQAEAASARVAELHAAKTDRYTALVEAGAVRLRPGVARLIGAARRQGVALAIATTTSLANVEALLRATLGPQGPAVFASIGAGDMVAAKKPAPDIYALVLAKLALPAGRCIAFEDSAIGLASALGTGVPTVVTPSLYTDDQSFPGALAVLSDLGEPVQAYRHLAGAGAAEGMVTLEGLAGWPTTPG
jgi:beta-phosphoglucomutase-like phosphatase (HAD superfamily)